MSIFDGIGNVQDATPTSNFLNSGLASIGFGESTTNPVAGTVQSFEENSLVSFNTKITIVKGVFIPATKVQGAVNRSHSVNTSGSSSVNAINNFNEIAKEGRLSESKLLELGSQIITTSAEHDGIVGIPYGWETQRLRFLIIFKVEEAGRSFYESLTGYTDFYELANNSVNPTMRLFFNNVIKLRPHMQVDPLGNMSERLSLISTRQILTLRDGVVGFDNNSWKKPSPKGLITPTAVFQNLQINSYFGGMSGNNLDTRTRVGSTGGGISLVNRTNTLGANMFANTAKAFNNALTSHTSSAVGNQNMRLASIYSEAADLAQAGESTVIEDHVLNRLKQMTDYALQGSVAWGDFCQVFPEAKSICALIKSKTAVEQEVGVQDAMYENSESWHSSHFTTMKAQTLLTAIPTVMIDCLLSDITFTATNMTLSGLDPLAIQVSSASSFLGEGMNNINLVNLFIQQFRNRIHPIISDNDDKQYTFSMRCDILGELRMSIHYDGLLHSYNYTAGVYADHLFTPIVTSSPNRLDLIANDLSNILTNSFH